MAYKATRRQWVKLWVNEWLDGTTRFKLTQRQRLLWIDLLALAGRSRFPGFIYAGEEDGKRVGYPLNYIAGTLGFDPLELNNALLTLASCGHIEVESPEPETYVIGIVNWDKYQSEYQRQKEYRQVNNSNKRSKSNGYKGGKFTTAEWMLLVTLSNNRCLRCGIPSSLADLCPDHVIPLSKNGSGDIFNIQPLCSPCNLEKASTSQDFRSKELNKKLQSMLRQSNKKGYNANYEQVRLEGEVEGEVEGEAEDSVSASAAWTSIGYTKAFGHKQFRSVWVARFASRGEKEWLTDVMEKTIQDCDHLGVKVPPQFFEAKREVEAREMASLPRRVPL